MQLHVVYLYSFVYFGTIVYSFDGTVFTSFDDISRYICRVISSFTTFNFFISLQPRFSLLIFIPHPLSLVELVKYDRTVC